MTDLPIEGTVVPIVQGTAVARAVDVSTTGDSGTTAQASITNLGESILSWLFNTSTAGTNPGSTFLALNNAAKDSATAINFNTTSNVDSARFDEMLTRLNTGDVIFLQSRTSTNKSILYRVTGSTTLDGTRVDVPVARERDQGAEFVADEVINVRITPKSAALTVNINETVEINATSSATLVSSLSSVTPALGDGYRISTAGTPFDGQEARLNVGDVLVAVELTPSTTDITDWGVIRRPAQLVAADVDSNYRNIIEHTGQSGTNDLSSLTSKVDALYPLTPDVEILRDWADIYAPNRAAATVTPVTGYSSFIDYRSDSDRFESQGITYDATGTDIVDYTGLGDDLHRVFGFKVTGASDQVLLTMVDGATTIPLVDMLTTGRYRVNNFTPAHAQDEVVTNRATFPPRSAGTGTLTAGGAVSTYTVADYPANTTAQSRGSDAEFDVLVNGTNTGAGGGVDFEIPDTDVAQAQRTVSHSFNLGPLHGNRRIDVVITYEFRVSGSDFLMDIGLQTAPSDVTLSVNSVAVFQNYTASVVIARVDDWLVLGDAGGDYTFTGGNEIIMAFHTFVDRGTMDVVSAAVTDAGVVTELNDRTIPLPPANPNFAEIRIPDDIEFRAFLPDHFMRHSDLSTLLRDRAIKWDYALARLETISEHAITEIIDLASGSKVAGQLIKVQNRNVVHQATGKGTASGELIQQLVLPSNFGAWSYLHVTEYITDPSLPEWRQVLIDVALLESADLGGSEVIRIQGNTDFVFTSGVRTLTSQGGSTVWRAVLLDL